jgi:NitT/TauT family transport system ATP-binding protein
MTHSAAPVLIAENLSKIYGEGQSEVAALSQVSFELCSRDFVAVLGPSGCGKTTLLRLLAGLHMPTAGQVFFDGNLMVGPRRRIGYVFQQANLMPWRSVRQNIGLPLELQGFQNGQIDSHTAEMISKVGLEGFEDTFPRDLSGGMAQRVAIGRALIHEPDVLLLDEPFGQLDALTRERMGTELLRIWTSHPVTVMMVTHSISEAVLLADRVLVLSQRPGRIKLDLPIELERPRNLGMTHTSVFGRLANEIRMAIAD